MVVNKLRKLINDKIFGLAKLDESYLSLPNNWENVPMEKGTIVKKTLDHEGVVAGLFDHKIDVTSHIHYHNSNEYIIVLKGEITVYTPNEVKVVKERETYFIPAWEPHYTAAYNGTVQLVVWIPTKNEEQNNDIIPA